MDEKLLIYRQLATLFHEKGFSLYLVGGTVRDFLMGLSLTDIDVVTDATPEEMKTFIDGNYRYEKMGSVSYKYEGVHFDITTLRKEKRYQDSRHPLDVKFVKKLKTDVKRRDFTINGMYMDSAFRLIDLVGGEKDLNNHLLKMIGNPYRRLKEDPLRIVRAVRFALLYDLSFDKKLKKAIKKNGKYLRNINIDKIKLDLKKMATFDQEKFAQILKELSIIEYLNMVN